MALEAATNCWTHAVQTIVESLPQCAGFRSLCGAADANAASAFVHQKQLSNYTKEEVYRLLDIEEFQSHAIVFSPTTNPYNGVRGRSGVLDPSGTVIVAIQRALLPTIGNRFDDNNDEQDRYFENRVGDIVGQLFSYTDDYKTLRILSISVVDATVRVKPSQVESQGNLQRATLLIQWGFQGP